MKKWVFLIITAFAFLDDSGTRRSLHRPLVYNSIVFLPVFSDLLQVFLSSILEQVV